MSLRALGSGNRLKYLIACVLSVMFVVLITCAEHIAVAQEAKTAVAAKLGSDLVARGRYIVEDVAMCGTCHTPRLPDGELDRSQWLAGASVPYLPAQPSQDWPILAPRLAGSPPAANAQMITLLTTAVWTDGRPLRDPMPHFHMTRSDAEAVVAYLKSL